MTVSLYKKFSIAIWFAFYRPKIFFVSIFWEVIITLKRKLGLRKKVLFLDEDDVLINFLYQCLLKVLSSMDQYIKYCC